MNLIEGKEFNYKEFIDKIPSNPIANYAFKNNGDYTFSNKTKEWGFEIPSFSNGAAYSDLDNDGDLDLIVNNVNSSSFLFQNMVQENLSKNYLQIILKGEAPNTIGIGAKVILFKDDKKYYRQQIINKGFQSSVDSKIHFGLNNISNIDSLLVIWPNNKSQALYNISTNKLLLLYQKDANKNNHLMLNDTTKTIFKDIELENLSDYKHIENEFIDFDIERLMPRMLSKEGPKIAKGDVNNDSLEDIYIGGSKDQSGHLFIQTEDRGFIDTNKELFYQEKRYEDQESIFFDANGDNYIDLYIVSGGNEFKEDSDLLLDRLYINNGDGTFKKAEGALPYLYISGSCVEAIDYDMDGDNDLFIGGRSIPKKYGMSPKSVLRYKTMGKVSLEKSLGL